VYLTSRPAAERYCFCSIMKRLFRLS